NVALGAEPRAAGLAGALGAWDRAKAAAEVARLSKEYGIAVDPAARVEILKVLYRGARILILDEPTAVLTPQEADALFATLKRLKAAGSTVVFISHKLKEVAALCDEATVLRRGKTVATRPVPATSTDELCRLMIGELKPPEDASSYRYAGEPAEVLRLSGVSLPGPRGGLALSEVSLTVRAGEVVGVAGVEGNGQRELAQVACGLALPTEGTVALTGRAAHIPEDRHKAAMLMPAPAWENMLLGRQNEPAFSTPWALKRPAILEHGRRVIADFDVRPPELEQAGGAFSGGNQQKFVVGRELSKDPALIVAAHPTRGVDLGASRLIHAKLLAAKAAGKAVLLISADLDEVLALSDRVVVLFAGRVMGEVPRAQATVERLGPWMAGVER
ncbi:MAG: ATP-binding cassette domain-containing protein, partial [Elusimicrobia bacterium]|nr:ATP-binding cassette domain-containing protein [Elusimicrobiota bacterium]